MFKQKIKLFTEKTREIINNKTFIIFFLIVGFIVILYNFVFFVGNNSVNIPFWDQWGLTDIITGKTDILKILFYQHNEHRIGVGLFIIKVLAHYSHWSQILEIKFISMLIVSCSLVISFIKYNLNKKFEILDIIIPLVILNIFQYENITWGFQIAFVLPLFFLCLWIFSLRIKNIKLKYTILAILSLLSTFSSFHGLLLPILTIILSIFEYFKGKSINIKIMILSILANIVIICSYFIGYVKSFQTTLSLVPSWPMLEYFSLAINNGFFNSRTNIFLNILVTISVLLFFFIGIFKLFKNKQRDNNILIGCLFILYSFMFISLISVGRSSFGVGQAFSSRYITFTMLIPIGLFFIFSSLKYGKYFKIILLTFILINSIFLTNKVIENANGMTINRMRALECYKTSVISNFNSCFKISPLFPDENYLNQRIVETLRFKKMYKYEDFDNNLSNYNITTAEKCDGFIDIINGISPMPSKLLISNLLSVNGWLATSTDKATLPDAVYVVLTDNQGKNRYLKTHIVSRPDVGTIFKNSKLNKSGYETIVDISTMEGQYTLGIAIKQSDKLELCPQFKIPTTITNN